MRLPGPIGIYALLDAGLLPPDELPAAAGEMAAAGVRVFQVRAKSLPAGDLLGLTRAVRAALPADAVVVVDDRADVAAAAGADGVHLGDEDLAAEDARRCVGPAAIVGLSTHGLDDVRAAAGLPIDYIGFGPVFASTTKVTGRRLLGLDGVRAAARLATVPVVAIGGVSIAEVRALAAAGASGVAMAAALLKPGAIRTAATEAVHAFAAGRLDLEATP